MEEENEGRTEGRKDRKSEGETRGRKEGLKEGNEGRKLASISPKMSYTRLNAPM